MLSIGQFLTGLELQHEGGSKSSAGTRTFHTGVESSWSVHGVRCRGGQGRGEGGWNLWLNDTFSCGCSRASEKDWWEHADFTLILDKFTPATSLKQEGG